MQDVAERAEVSRSTVSRSLRGQTYGIRPEIEDRIARIAADLGYRPNLNAASLITGRTHAFGVLVPRLSDIVLSTIYEGIEEAATERGFQTLVANTRDDPREQRRRIDLLLDRRVDGLIIGDAHRDGNTLRANLSDRGIPFVLVNRRVRGFISATCDDLRGGRLVGEHLARIGHQHVGIVAGLTWASTGLDRVLGCREALADHGVTVTDQYVTNSTFDAAGGRAAAERLLDLTPRPTAIFAVNDFAAIGVMGAARDRGLRVGEDLAVVGYNDISIARDLPVPLTTVACPLNSMGRAAAKLLLDTLEGKQVRSIKLPPTIVVRGSTSA